MLNVAGSGSSPEGRPLCAFCGRSFSQYTCPSCNAGYCSLSCYRSEAHSQCTESFYRKEVEDQIRTEPRKTPDDRRKMMEILKNLDEDHLEDEASGSDDEELSLANRFDGLNIDSLGSDQLWSLLSEEERATFLETIQNPTSESAQELLATHNLETQYFAPWWRFSDKSKSSDPGEQSRNVNPSPPPLENIPYDNAALANPNLSLIYNLFAITLAYAFATRHLVSSPLANVLSDEYDSAAAREDIAKAAPFLVERKSSMIFESVDQVVTEVWSRMDAVSSNALIQLLHDVTILLQPEIVTTVDIQNSSLPPKSKAHLMLSDLHAIFLPWSSTKSKRAEFDQKPKINHVAMKIAFYAAQVDAFPSSVLARLCSSVEQKIASLEIENLVPTSRRGDLAQTVGGSLTLDTSHHTKTPQRTPLIEEVE